MIEENRHAKNWREYQKGLEYLGAQKIAEKTKRNIDFFEGRQWAEATERTKTMPRPVSNFIKFICRNKRALMTSVPVRLVFQATSQEIDAKLFTEFAEYMTKEMRLDEYDARAVKDAVIKGTYVYHFYWDKDIIGLPAKEEGALRVETIDLRKVFVANPLEVDEQKQRWIIVASREHIETVKAMADEGVDESLIVADDHEKSNKEQDNSGLCTVLLKYFRKDGEVYWERSVKGTMINAARPLAPDETLAKKDLKEKGIIKADPENPASPDNALNAEKKPRPKSYLYPIVIGQYEEQEDSIYGISEVEGLIPNQQIINYLSALQTMATEANSWGKWIVKPDALQGQEISNESGQVLTDYSKDQYGIRKADPPNASMMPIYTIKNIIEHTRTVAGATEILTGELSKGGQSGVAIAQLQAQATQPIEELRERFWRNKEKQGLIMAQFFKNYYHHKPFAYVDSVIDEETQQVKERLNERVFNGSDFADVNFSVVVEAVKGVRSSTAGDIQMLETMFTKGEITALEFVKAYPSDMLRDKNEIVKIVEGAQNNKLKQLTQELQVAGERVIELGQLVEKQNKVIEDVVPIVQQNNQLRALVAQLTKEATQKIDLANQMIGEYEQTYNDAQMFAQMLGMQEGMIPTQSM